MTLAPQVPVKTTTRAFRLEDANTALAELRAGRLEGAAVLVTDDLEDRASTR